MSLIQEALRRQQEEASGKSPETKQPPPPPAATPSPPPSPQKAETAGRTPSSGSRPQTPETRTSPAVPPVIMETGRSKRPVATLIGVAVLVLILIAAGAWFVWYYALMHPAENTETSGPSVAKTTGTTINAAPSVPASAVPSKAVAPSVVKTTPSATVPGPKSPVATPELRPEVRAPEVAVAQSGQTAKTLPPVPQPATNGPAAQAAAVSPTPPATVKAIVIWPALTLSGVVGRGPQGTAIINKEILGINETILGVRIVSIERQGATLEFQGETQFLKVGNSTK